MPFCPCGTQNNYDLCCGLYLDQNLPPKTPEQLMRSRYSAYYFSRIDYIKKTMKGRALNHFNDETMHHPIRKITWISLEVTQIEMRSSTVGFVSFVARFLENNRIKSIHERSEFHCDQGVWFYVDGIHQKTASPLNHTIPFNASCPCGSGKKFKNCHKV